MADPYNFFGKSPPAPQALAAAMMPVQELQIAQAQAPTGHSMPDASSLSAMLQQQNPYGYSPMNRAWDTITDQAPGNPLGLTSGTKFTPDDLLKLKGAFNG